MGNYRGLEGFLAIGGVLSGSGAPPKLNGAYGAAATLINIDGNGSQLIGIVVAGDTFTIAGETGSPTHTVTGGPFYVASANSVAGITFTPAIATGGVADNAVVTFTSNSVAEAKAHSLNVTLQVLETTRFQDKWRTVRGGLAQWTGTGTAHLDKDDPEQGTLLDAIIAATPNLTLNGVLFGLQLQTTLLKQMYGGVVLSGFNVTAEKGAIIEVTFNFEGTGTLLPNWT